MPTAYTPARDAALSDLRTQRRELLHRLERACESQEETEDIRIAISENRGAIRDRLDAMKWELDSLRLDVLTRPGALTA